MLAAYRRGGDIMTLALTHRHLLRLALIVMVAPSALTSQWFRNGPAIALVLASVGAVALIATDRSEGSGALDARVKASDLLPALALACGLLLLGGALHWTFPTRDWLIRDAVLADMTRQQGLPVYDMAGVAYYLRAPLGMYVAPAAAGHVTTLVGAHVALLLQNALLLGIVLHLFRVVGRGWTHVAIMLAFGGPALLGAALLFPGLARIPDLVFSPDRSQTIDVWAVSYQYSSSVVQFFWAPNHALPGWMLALLIWLRERKDVDLATLAIGVGIGLFWSPLAILPAALWCFVCFARAPLATLSSQRLWIAVVAGLGFSPLALYVTTGAGAIESAARDDALFIVTIVFVALNSFALLYIWRFRAHAPATALPLVLFCAAVLVALPFFSFGPGNDLVSRGSISCLVLAAFFFGWIWLDRDLPRPAFFVGAALMLLAAPSGLMEIARAVTMPTYAISDCTLMEANASLGSRAAPANYATPVAARPDWLLRPMTDAPAPLRERVCWTHRSWSPAAPYVKKPYFEK